MALYSFISFQQKETDFSMKNRIGLNEAASCFSCSKGCLHEEMMSALIVWAKESIKRADSVREQT